MGFSDGKGMLNENKENIVSHGEYDIQCIFAGLCNQIQLFKMCKENGKILEINVFGKWENSWN